MKKFIFAVSTVAMSLTLTSCGLGSTGLAGSALNSVLGNSGTTASNVASGVANAVTSASTLENLLSSFLGQAAVTETQLQGTWTYQGVDVAFESDNLLAQAGGAAVAGTLESKLDTQLQKYGIKPGNSTFTFNKDKTFKAVINGQLVNGTYTYDASTRKLNLIAALGLFNQTCTVGTTTKGISLLFDADKLLSLVSTAGTLAGSTSSIGQLSSLVSNYKGMQIGLGLTK